MTRTVCYATNFGGYDDCGRTAAMDQVDFIWFTDNPYEEVPPPWQVVVDRERRYEHPRMAAKFYKCRPDVVFPEYDLSVYTDASMHRANHDLVTWAVNQIGADGFACFRHPYFTDIAQDAELSVTLPKYASQPIVAQVGHYRAEGFPLNLGHYATGVLARRHNELRHLGHAWLHECERWSYQDQLSLPVVAWRLGVNIATFDAPQLDNPYVSPGGHRRQD